MKKAIICAFILIGVSLLNSCKNDEVLNNNQELNNLTNFTYKKVTNPEIINGFLSKASTLKSSEGISFNLENIYELDLIGRSQKFYYILQTGFDECNNSNYGLFNAMNKNGDFGKPLIIKTEKFGEDKIISYYNDANQLIVSLKLVSATETVEVLSLKSANDNGQETADCIVDAYSNHGWISSWLWVQTLIIPTTGVIIAADCALHAILNV